MKYLLLLFACAACAAQESTPVKTTPATAKASEPAEKASPRLAPSAWEPRYRRYQAAKLAWMHGRGAVKTDAERDDLYNQYVLAYREWFESKY